MSNRILLFIIILLGAFRFLWLGQFPPGLSNDETEYILSAKTYALFDRDVSGYGLPLSLVKSETDDVIAPMPSVLSSVFFNFMPLNLLTARLPYVVASFLTAIGIYYLSQATLKNKTASLLAVIVFLANPWSFYMSRNTADAPFALMFNLWAIVLLIKHKGTNLLAPSVLFILGFFSYHGAKTVFLPLVFVLTFYLQVIAKHTSRTRAALFVSAMSVFFIVFFVVAARVPGSLLSLRSDDVIIDAAAISSEVDAARQQSITTPLQAVFFNKYTVVARTLFERYVALFNPVTFFVSGDPRATYHFGDYGLFHPIDVVLLMLGAFALFAKNRKEAILLGLIAFVAPVSSALSSVDVSVVNRSFLLMPIMIIVIAQGIYVLGSWTRGKARIFIQIVVAVALTLSFASFLNFYFFTFPISAQENYWTSERALVRYLATETRPSVWVSTEPWNSTMRMIFYSNQEDQAKYLASLYPLNQKIGYKIGSTLITPNCPTEISENVVYAVSHKVDCDLGEPSLVIQNHKDAGHVIAIYNSKWCNNPDTYRRFNGLNDYFIEDMDEKTLCNRWFNSPN